MNCKSFTASGPLPVRRELDIVHHEIVESVDTEQLAASLSASEARVLELQQLLARGIEKHVEHSQHDASTISNLNERLNAMMYEVARLHKEETERRNAPIVAIKADEELRQATLVFMETIPPVRRFMLRVMPPWMFAQRYPEAI